MLTTSAPVEAASAGHLFVYGTLVEPRRLDEVLGHRHPGERLRARLRGFRRVTTTDYAYPFLVLDAEGVVDGILIMALAPADMVALDAYEEVDSGTYTRTPVDVEAWGCGPNTMHVSAQAYVAGPLLQRLVAPSTARTAPSTAI